MKDLLSNRHSVTERVRPTLSVVAISCNEEVDLPGFLDNLLPWVDEIVIVDDGSTDNTINISQKAGLKVKIVEQAMNKKEGFSGQRNRGIDKAGSDWLLHMDIDERVPPRMVAEIVSSIQTKTYNAFRYNRLNFFLHRPMRGGGLQDWNNPQLARNGKHYFKNAVHEQCVVEGGSDCIGQLREKMWHLNDDSYQERMQKSMIYCRHQARCLSDKNIKIRWFHLVLLPLFEFLRKYLLKAGYRDGVTGLLWALHTSDAMFRACALVWDEQNQVDRSVLEERLKKMWNDQNG